MSTVTTDAAQRAQAQPPRKRSAPWGLRLAPYLFLLPNMAIFGVFTIWPAINGVNISLYSSSDGRRFRWEGLGNYERILTDSDFWGVALNTSLFAVGYLFLSVTVGVLLAVLVNQQHRGRAFFRSAFFVPVLISPVVAGLVWNWMLERRGGLVNSFLDLFGVEEVPWLIDQNLALGSVIFVGVWLQLGFYMLILLAGLQGIDPNVYEASQIDGASRWRQFWSMTLPLLQPSILVVVILSTIHGFQAFDFIFTLTGGGPVGATTLIVQYIYDNGFVSPIRYGMATAGSVLLFFVVFTLTIINWLIGRRRERA